MIARGWTLETLVLVFALFRAYTGCLPPHAVVFGDVLPSSSPATVVSADRSFAFSPIVRQRDYPCLKMKVQPESDFQALR